MQFDPARVDAALPGYELGEVLGWGTFGLVLAGRHRRLNRDVAIKILVADPDGATAGFAAEAQLLAALIIHMWCGSTTMSPRTTCT